MNSKTLGQRLRAQYRELPPHGLELHRPGEERWMALVLNSYGEDKPYKLQCFGMEGLGAHYLFARFDQALRAAVRWGYTEVATGRLQALMDGAAWRQRYRVEVVPPQRLPHGRRARERGRRQAGSQR